MSLLDRRVWRLATVAAAFLLLSQLPQAARAADGAGDIVIAGAASGPRTNIVITLADSGPGSLRQAVADSTGGDVVTFDSMLAGGTITLATGQILIDKDLSVAGLGGAGVTVSGNNSSRVFEIAPGVTAILEGLTITDGRVSGDPAKGGGVLNNGTLTLRRMMFSNNAAVGGYACGGGLYNGGNVTVDRCTFRNNAAIGGGGDFGCDGLGGAIYDAVNRNLVAYDSTFSGNSAQGGTGAWGAGYSMGGAICDGNAMPDTGSKLLRNCTISGNTASGENARGGGCLMTHQAVYDHVTIVGNSASEGGGVYSANYSNPSIVNPVLRSCIIANNTASYGPDLGNAFESGGFNLIKNTADWIQSGVMTGNLYGIDPMLGPLADNGGPTFTCLPLAGSPVVDAINPASDSTATDQRGMPRPQGAAVDIGSVDVEMRLLVTPNAGPFAGGNTVTITNGSFGTVTNVLVGGVPAALLGYGAQWVAIRIPEMASAGRKDIVVQTAGNGDVTLASAYTVCAPASALPLGCVVYDDSWLWKGAPLRWRVVHTNYGGTAGSVTLSATNMIASRAFLDGGWNNRWKDATLRTYLNGSNFYGVFSAAFTGIVQKTAVPWAIANPANEPHAGVVTDAVFIASRTELGGPALAGDGAVFAWYADAGTVTNRRRAVGSTTGASWYWTRTGDHASYSGTWYDMTAWLVKTGDGSLVCGNWTYDPFGAVPVVNIQGSAQFAEQSDGTYRLVAPMGQSIAFAAPTAVQFGADSLHLAASASSGLPVRLSVLSGPAMLTGETELTFTGVGDVTVVAAQSGNSYWTPAASVTNVIKICQLSAGAGPFVGGNTVTISNGYFGTVTNVLVGGVAATVQGSGPGWLTIVLPATGADGVKDIVIQTADYGDITLPAAYTVNPAGKLGGMVADGFTWTNMAQGFGDSVYAVHVSTGGVLYAGGAFASAVDGASTPRIAKWNGAAWTNVGIGFNNSVREIREDSAGALYAVGDFNGTFGNSQNCRRIGRWDGENWTNMSKGVSSAGYTVTFDANDVPYFGGTFTTDGYLHYFGCVVKWNGASWTNIYESGMTNGIGFNNTVITSVRGLDGTLYFGGDFTSAVTPTGSAAMSGVAMWDGTELRPMGAGFNGRVNKLVVDSRGTLYAGGSFTASGGQSINRVARWDGENWTNVGSGVNSTVYALGFDAQGNLYAGGSFTSPGNRLAMWDGAAWHDAGGIGGINNTVMSLACVSNETMVVGGEFTSAGGVATNRIGQVWPNRVYNSGTTPSSGSWAGGYTVAIMGENIGNGRDITSVTLCGIQATIQSQSVDRVWVTAGVAATAGAGDVVVQSTSYGETVGTNAFTYSAPGMQVLGTNGAVVASGDAAQTANGTKFVSLHSGSSWTNTFTIANDGTETLNISGFGISDARFEIAGLPATVAAGTASTFTVRFAPGAAGSYAGALTISNDSPTAVYGMNLAGSCFTLSTDAGPLGGGNTITITNGHFGTITNVLVGGVAAAIQSSGANWVTITVPAIGSAGAVDIVVQTSDNGDTTLAGAYTVNPAGRIGGEPDWSRWVEVASLPASRFGMSVAAVSNRIYAVSGANMYGTCQTNVYCYDGTNWTEVPGLPAGRRNAVAGEVNGALILAGGAPGPAGVSTNVYRFTGAGWEEVAALPAKIANMAGATYNGALYVIGGYYSGSATNVVYRFDGTSWTEVAGLPAARYDMGAAACGGYLYAVGGVDSPFRGNPCTNVYRYNGTSWTEVAGLPAPRTASGVAAREGSLFVVGGYTEEESGMGMPMSVPHNNVYRFDGTTWTEMAELPQAWYNVPLASLNSGLYAFDGTTMATNVYRYPATAGSSGVEPASGSWAGGYEVVISGVNLCDGADVTNVTLCGVSAAIQSQSATQIVVTAGAVTAPGVGDVRVFSTSFGETAKFNAFEYLCQQQASLVFNPASPQAYLTTNALAVSGGSGTGAVSYAVLDGPGAIVDGTNLAVTAGSGTVRVCATKAGDALYLPVAVTSVVAAVQGGQVIDFPPVADQLTTNVVALGATASSGLAVTFSVAGGPASLDGNVLRFTGAGTVSVVASQPGDANWLAAPERTNSFAVSKAGAAVALTNLLQTYDGTPRAVMATTAPAGLAVSFRYGERQSLGVVGSGDAPVPAGRYAVTGTVIDDFYSGFATGTLVVAKAAQAIDFAPVADQLTTNVVALGATASSGLAVTFSVAGGPASIDGNVLRFTGAGTVSVVASQPGDANWLAAPEMTNSFVVSKAGATVALTNLLQTYDGTPRAVTATTAPAGLAVSFRYGERQSLGVVGSGDAPVPAGRYAVTGIVIDDFYSGFATGTLVVAKAAQAIDFAPVAPQAVTSVVALAATGGASGNPVTFSVVSGPGVIDGASLSFSAAGEVAVVASQAGTENYTAAPDVTNVVPVFGVVTSVTPQHGVKAGGNEVRIDGLWLGDGTNITSVTLCGVEATIVSQAVHSVWVLSGATNIAADLTGPVHVVSGFGDAALLDAFTYHVLAQPVALPATQISSAAFKAHWSLVPEADHYVIDVSTTSNFTDFVAGYSNQFVGVADNAWVNGLSDGSWYWYRLRACTSNDVQSLNSNVIGVPAGGTVPWVAVSNMTGMASGGGTQEFPLNLIFAGAGLSFSATSDAPAIVTVQIDAATGVLRLTYPGASGTATVTVTAAHLATGYQVSYSFAVTIIGAPAYGVGALKSSSMEVYQIVTVTNTANVAAEGVMVTVGGLDDTAYVLNRTSVNGRGEAVIEYPHSLAPGASAAIKVVYARAYGAQVLQGRPAAVAAHLVLPPLREEPPSEAVASAVVGAWRRADGCMVIAFRTVPGAEYMIQYRDSMSEVWKNVYPAVTASGPVTYWVDSGQPVTEAHPKDVPARFYQILSYPNN